MSNPKEYRRVVVNLSKDEMWWEYTLGDYAVSKSDPAYLRLVEEYGEDRVAHEGGVLSWLTAASEWVPCPDAIQHLSVYRASVLWPSVTHSLRATGVRKSGLPPHPSEFAENEFRLVEYRTADGEWHTCPWGTVEEALKRVGSGAPPRYVGGVLEFYTLTGKWMEFRQLVAGEETLGQRLTVEGARKRYHGTEFRLTPYVLVDAREGSEELGMPRRAHAEVLPVRSSRLSNEAEYDLRRDLKAATDLVEKQRKQMAERFASYEESNRRRIELADKCGALATENRELLVENATLRRKVEALERRAKK